MSTRSPAGKVFKVAVAGGIAMQAVSAGLVRRAFSSFAQPQPWILLSCSSWHSSESNSGSSVFHCIFFACSFVMVHSWNKNLTRWKDRVVRARATDSQSLSMKGTHLAVKGVTFGILRAMW